VERHEVWPLFGLRLRCGDVELSFPTEDELVELATLATTGIHAPDAMPFRFPWSRDPDPSTSLRFWWAQRGAWQPDDWTLAFAVRHLGRLVGVQELIGRNFAVRRSVETASWLARSAQGRGVGTAMRAAVLTLAFDGLDAMDARSGAFLDNPASLRVSRKLGYADDGTEVYAREGRRAIEQRFAMSAQVWRATPREPVEIEGLEPCLPLLGLTG